MGESMGNMRRTHMCGVLREENVNQEVTLMGWVQKRRNLGGLVFVDLRDTTGLVQIVFDTDVSDEAFKKAEVIRSEYVLAIKGIVKKRESVNKEMPTGDIEVFVSELKILDEAETPPIYIKDNDDVSDVMRLKYRYLDLRKPFMQKNLKTRHKTMKVFRDFLDENNFNEIETPMLTKPTPEGARDYLVPSRVNPGRFYALPQSPQLMKQLLMVSGMDRYYQIVKCFRDEDLRANRQPEFTQVDIEMSFVDVDDVIEINERLIQKIFKEIKGIDIKLPIRRMTYKEAMDRYGSDKPDLRFGYELKNLSDILANSGFKAFASVIADGGSVRAIKVEEGANAFSKKGISKLEKFAKTYGAKGLAWIKVEEDTVNSPIAKFLSEEEIKAILERTEAKNGDIIFIVGDKDSVVYDSLGHLRIEVAKKLDNIPNDVFELLWITEFPLLEYSEEEDRYVAKHHPFTHPMDEDIDMLETEPHKVRAKAYDIVINGDEIGGGSIRINNSKLQSKMFKALGFSEEEAWSKFGFLLEAFKYGVPPHGGIAYGLGRFLMLLTGMTNLRDVIAFPKTQNATCLMTEAPANVTKKQLEELSIDIKLKDSKE
ncbi:aspartate--tRNA ligase [Abyssisolibacter fermentans]|uniref:aspartate--tRNA ligase n=1 Tax=Abyssisolibacter fermentans TaxID=1766203 RepID=UPI00082E17CC|nr:aspartate--tRNA ligase [Abyssisolibacter fermentans]